MSKYSVNNFWKSFMFALRGLSLLMKSQKNFRRQVLFFLLGIFIALWLKFSYIEFAILILAMFLVPFAEIINSVIEFTLDSYTRNRYSKLVEMAKDMAAGCVLLSSCISFAVCAILFWGNIKF